MGSAGAIRHSGQDVLPIERADADVRDPHSLQVAMLRVLKSLDIRSI